MMKAATGGKRAISPMPVALMAALLVSALPVLSVAYPPVLDYPNHLARIWLLSGKVNDAPLSTMYASSWSQASTNIAVDFLAASLARIIPIGAVNLLLLLALFLAPPLTAILLNRALCRRWHMWQIATLFLAWSTTAVAGFLNFQIGLAAALLCAALIASMPDIGPGRKFLLHLVSAALLLLIHPFALFFYAALASGLILGERAAIPATARDLVPLLGRIGGLALACILPLAALFLFAPEPPGVHANGASGILWSAPSIMFDPLRIAKALASPILTYDAFSDILLFLPLAACLAWAVWSGHVRFHGGLLIAAMVLAFLACLAPEEIGDASWIQRRLPPMAALALAAAIMPAARVPGKANLVMTVAIAAALLMRVAWVETVWIARQPDLAGLKEATAGIPRGASVIVARQDPAKATGLSIGRLMAGSPGPPVETGRHLVAPFAVQRGFFIPTLFTVPGQQPLSVRPEWRSRSVYISAIPRVDRLGTADAKDPYVRAWRRDFDYLLVLNADIGSLPTAVAAHVRPVSGEGFARLYRIIK